MNVLNCDYDKIDKNEIIYRPTTLFKTYLNYNGLAVKTGSIGLQKFSFLSSFKIFN